MYNEHAVENSRFWTFKGLGCPLLRIVELLLDINPHTRIGDKL